MIVGESEHASSGFNDCVRVLEGVGGFPYTTANASVSEVVSSKHYLDAE
jgi:hypothetical protein